MTDKLKYWTFNLSSWIILCFFSKSGGSVLLDRSCASPVSRCALVQSRALEAEPCRLKPMRCVEGVFLKRWIFPNWQCMLNLFF